MQGLLNVEPWWRFAAALLIGALIGIEREIVQQREEGGEFAGIRTFALIALFGALAAYSGQILRIEIFLIAYGGFLLLMVGGRIAGVLRDRTEGMTTEVVALITPLLGALVIWDQVDLAAALSVIIALVLSLKLPLHRIARTISDEDLRATLQFGLISLVILPLLPNHTVDPLGILNPFEIWLLVILVSGISFVGYLLMKFGSPNKGIGVAALLGGLVSSTAATVSFSDRAKTRPQYSDLAAMAVVMATASSFPVILVEILAVHPPLLQMVVLPLASMLLASAGVAFYLWRRRSGEPDEEAADSIEVTNPLRFQTALLFAVIFTVVLVFVRLARDELGGAGVFLASGLSGLTGVDSIALSASKLASAGQLDLWNAALSILIAVFVNMIFKLSLAHILGSKQIARIMRGAFAVILVVGGVATWVGLSLVK
jgi:uncharacterized membrane protein (DUF4010 family)